MRSYDGGLAKLARSREMFEGFNGAKLFIATGPMLHVFGVSTVEVHSELVHLTR